MTLAYGISRAGFLRRKMSNYILGIITGIMITGFTFIFAIMLKNPIDRQIKQIQSRIKEKGKILEPEDEELISWVESIKKDE